MNLIPLVILIAYATFFYRAMESDGASALGGAIASIIMSVLTLSLGGLLLQFVGQVALFIGIAVVRAWRSP